MPFTAEHLGTGLFTRRHEYPQGAPSPRFVICSYPLSGQYGPGSRALYYALVAVCIFARRKEWLRSACLAAALLLPAIASIHGIVLASFSESNLIDLDIYGVQTIIGVATLAVPMTLRFSKTYFNTPGRNLVFLWTLLNLAGLIALSVAFFRAKTSPCVDSNKQLIWPLNPSSCELDCSGSPPSPLRQGPNNDVQKVFAPSTGLTLNTATLLSVAFCVPTFLSLVTMWNRVLLSNAWKLGFLDHEDDSSIIPGNKGDQKQGAVKRFLGWLSEPSENFSEEIIKLGLHLIELLVYSGAIIAIVIISELNFWSGEMRTGVEPITAVGQWSPIVGVILSGLGTLYATISEEEIPMPPEGPLANNASREACVCQCPAHAARFISSPTQEDDAAREHDINTLLIQSTTTENQNQAPRDRGGRRRVADIVRRAGSYFFDPSPSRYNHEDFRRGRYRTYPRTPGEERLNPDLRTQEETFYRVRSGHSQNSLVQSTASQNRSTTSLRSIREEPEPGGGGPTRKATTTTHQRSDSSASQFLEVPPDLHRSPRHRPIPLEPLPPLPPSTLEDAP